MYLWHKTDLHAPLFNVDILVAIYIQWNLPKTDTIGAEPCVHLMEGVLYSEVFAFGPSAYVL